MPVSGTWMARTVHAGTCLERARLVVDAGVDDPAVVPGLVGRDPVFLLQQQQAQARMGLAEGQRGGEADDAAAHDGEIGALGHNQKNIIPARDRKSTRLNSSHVEISYAVFCLKKK